MRGSCSRRVFVLGVVHQRSRLKCHREQTRLWDDLSPFQPTQILKQLKRINKEETKEKRRRPGEGKNPPHWEFSGELLDILSSPRAGKKGEKKTIDKSNGDSMANRGKRENEDKSKEDF